MAAKFPKTVAGLRKRFPGVADGLQFAKNVVAGKVPACRYVVLACQRHLDDLDRVEDDGFDFYFDPEAAEKKLSLIELMPFVKGEWAHKRQLVSLEPWQKFGLMATFGWMRKSTGLRRFRESYWEVGRKNGKSVIAAGIGICMFVADGEVGAEVYSGATSEKQAWEVFRPARLMVKRSPMLVEHSGIEVNASNMNLPADESRFEPIIGDPGDGASPSCAIVDEYHEHRTSSLYDTMLTGMGARRQPLMFVITTAGSDIAGPCYDKRRAVVEMLEGSTPDDELFGWIWTIDEGDDWTDPGVLAKANPNIGVSVYREYLLSQQQRAINNARFANTFKMKHLNVWTSAKSAFFNMASWNECEDRSLSIDDFEGQPCVLGFDLARKLDMNSVARVFTREIDGKTHYYSVSPKFYVPEDAIFDAESQRMAERFRAWLKSGHLTATDGAEIDYRQILADVIEINHKTPVEECPIDPHGATALSHDLDDEGFTPITVTQNYTNLSDAMKELEAAVMSGRFHHDGNPIMTWCASNVIGKTLPGNDDVVRPIKQGTENKIDGVVALIMAVGRAMVSTNDISDFLNDPLVLG